jgi:hypothetical protein
MQLQPIPESSRPDPYRHKGAIEGDCPSDEQFGNSNADALDAEGLPADEQAIFEDALGASVDATQG